MTCFEEGLTDLDRGIVTVDVGVEGKDAGGGQVDPGGYGSVWVDLLQLDLVVVVTRRGTK